MGKQKKKKNKTAEYVRYMQSIRSNELQDEEVAMINFKRNPDIANAIQRKIDYEKRIAQMAQQNYFSQFTWETGKERKKRK